jgi:predicted DNA-binding transcriptional regulator AlpA
MQENAAMTISASIHVPDRIINEKATAEILGISRDTLRRLNRRGEGPTRRKISPRRVGYKFSEVEAYLDGVSASDEQPNSKPARRPQRGSPECR